jgi:hypothetical protein
MDNTLDDKIDSIKKDLVSEMDALRGDLEIAMKTLQDGYHINRNGIVRSAGCRIDALAALYEELNTLRNQGYKRG